MECPAFHVSNMVEEDGVRTLPMTSFIHHWLFGRAGPHWLGWLILLRGMHMPACAVHTRVRHACNDEVWWRFRGTRDFLFASERFAA